MDWSEDDIITMDKYRAAFPEWYHKTDVFYKSDQIEWRGKKYGPPSYEVPFILSGHSDYEITDTQASKYPDTTWFSVNASTPCVYGLPYGITPKDPELPHTQITGDTSIVVDVARTPKQQTNLVYMNFSIDTYPKERQVVWDMFHDKPWVTCGTYGLTVESRRSFLSDIRNHAFVLCPRGNGIDTIRLWETLYMGSIPIVKQDIVHKDWQDLPILFIQSWDEVTEDFLRTKQVEFESKQWSTEKLKIGYWIERIRKMVFKPLVYYTVGYSPVYIDILALSITSLRNSGYSGDIAVICDHSLLPRCKESIGDNVRYMRLPDSKTPEEASMNKLRIFDLPGIESYDRVLFLDSDILVHTSVYSIFRGITRPGILYVYSETTKQEDHKSLIWSLQDYTPLDLAIFQMTPVHVFNAGCFAFVRGDGMRNHFLAIQGRIVSHTGRFFYEQSFMNAYFNRNGQTDRTLLTEKNYVFDKGNQSYQGRLVHFAGDPGSGKTKLQRMKDYARTHLYRE